MSIVIDSDYIYFYKKIIYEICLFLRKIGFNYIYRYAGFPLAFFFARRESFPLSASRQQTWQKENSRFERKTLKNFK